MSLLRDNPLGVALAALLGGLVLVALALVVLWNRPVPPLMPEDRDGATAAVAGGADVARLGPPGAYSVIVDRPAFNESRQPEAVVADAESDDTELVADSREAPPVRLTGVVITPEEKLVSLTSERDGTTFVGREGQRLEGEYSGWMISLVSPRQTVLTGQDGRDVPLKLEVHDAKIDEPPPPEPRRPQPAPVEGDVDGADGEAGGQDGDERLTRAEEIRQRIAERREELRREQEQQADGAENSAQQRQIEYRDAIRNLMGGNRGNNGSDDGNDTD